MTQNMRKLIIFHYNLIFDNLHFPPWGQYTYIHQYTLIYTSLALLSKVLLNFFFYHLQASDGEKSDQDLVVDDASEVRVIIILSSFSTSNTLYHIIMQSYKCIVFFNTLDDTGERHGRWKRLEKKIEMIL